VNHTPQLATTIGKYRAIATLGRGGMAHILLARVAGPLGFSKLFVLKVLRDDLALGNEECIAMFMDEARIAARLSHPNIVQTYDVGESEGRYFIAMEHLEGQTLRALERRMDHDSFSLAQRIRVLIEVAKALHHAHELRDYDGAQLNVVHRDVSPQNVFITYDGQIKLLDFGIAKMENALHFTQLGMIQGKIEYISPEQVKGEKVDRRADVFALGVMLYEAITRRRFAGGAGVSDVAKMHGRVTGSERKLREVCPDVFEPLALTCERATALSPAERHDTALEFAQDLERCLAALGEQPTADELAAILDRAFAQERAQMRQQIDDQMRLMAEPVTGLELKSLVGARLSQTPSAGVVSPEVSVSVVQRVKRKLTWQMAAGGLAFLAVIATYLALQSTRGALASAPEPVAQPLHVATPAPVVTHAAPKLKPRLEAQPRPSAPAVHVEHEVHSAPANHKPIKHGHERAKTEPPVVSAKEHAAPVAAPAARSTQEFEPGGDFRDIAPQPARRGEIELEEGLYQ
jgi:serine/threonine protein kinase